VPFDSAPPRSFHRPEIAHPRLTTAVAFVDLGMFNVAVALGIATGKMLLVALFFMHVKHSSALTKLILWARCCGWRS
jgi:caa(3)-type oxidase subunit IV